MFFANSLDFVKTSTNQFLDNYYSKSYNFGKSIETKADNMNIIVSEILDKTSGIINGYIVINKENDGLLYFVDYMRDTQEIKTVNFTNNVTEIINLKKDNKFDAFVKTDLIKKIKNVDYDLSSTMRFWGTSCGGVWTDPAGTSYQTCCYYVLWVNTGCEIQTVQP